MTWEIFLGISALFGFCVAVIKPVVSLTQAITKLNSSCDELGKNFIKFDESNAKSHQKLWKHIDDQNDVLAEHTLRLHDLDGK